MNCKPGDLALCIKGEQEGKTCEIISLGDAYKEKATGQFLQGWLISFPRSVKWGQPNGWDSATEGWYPDAWLKPLRDPGPGAVDETLREREVA
ncbi:hypothetical protein RD110_10910 [Rhodoferax koreense]|uniref:Uncharacterized protein n=1 Tax=Rhodoferax koreensis TaxID=1842727 RepID=A0A1P8JV60_9BURK|nr:hypothetical protein [Rhodoferax koreense]APW37637.1 hypothetical protein RD110_10910 [Rhodoferax koreense]